jgi:Fe-S-cluster-containing dehydrogenase component/anaerobic selenocysteine-containing dehydrogenase
MDDRLWRGPHERAGLAHPRGEFPEGADQPPEVTRRGLLRILGASAALAGGAGCSRGPPEDIVPYVDQPPEVRPSVGSRYATTMSLGGYGVGMIVESHEGRPTKAEGNPRHPASLGALGTLEQASVLSLYDPARPMELTFRGEPATWDAFVAAVAAPQPTGKRLHVLAEPTGSPHVADLVRRVRRRADAVVHFWAPVSRSNAWEGSRLAFGRVLEPRWDFSKTDVVLSLDADFLAAAAVPLAWARAWAGRRRMTTPAESMSRLYVVEPRLSVTGMAADERLAVRARRVKEVAIAVLRAIVALGAGEWAGAEAARRAVADARASDHDAWAKAVARDLHAHRGAGLVVAGDGQPPEVHALAHAMNEALGNAGTSVVYAPSPVFEAGDDSHDPTLLLGAIDRGEVGALVVLGGDPLYTAPPDFEMDRRLRAIPTTVCLGGRTTRTGRACAWFLPELHFLEAWGDATAFDGTPSIAQPLIRPMVEGKSAPQVLAALAGMPDATTRALVEDYWRSRTSRPFEDFWEAALVTGIAGSPESPVEGLTVGSQTVARAAAQEPPAARVGLEVVYFADAKVHDGRFADNAWLQELPDPVTKLTWDNAVLLGPATAAARRLETSDVVDLVVRGRTVRAPVLVVPGVAEGVAAIAVGYGQDIEDRVSHGVGADVYRVRDSRAPWFDDGELTKVAGSWPLALTQEHWSMEGRPIVLRETVAGFRARPDFARPRGPRPPSLYRLRPAGVRQWGMTIDLNACTGCSACVVACTAENNVPVVGKGGVALGREMHWLRIDRYFGGSADAPTAVVQPMLCQHCEKAPCEYVCPVNATVHSSEGLNEMIYNRCVGTRFCSNNCPYKVRRFNFFNYSADKPASLRLAMNPDVTVRARGVMEKCTYCVQRIEEAEIRARREGRPVADGEVVTACQGTCPTGAIVFGDIADRSTRVSRSMENGRLYQVLHELGTEPRTRYLARVVNPNPELAGG